MYIRTIIVSQREQQFSLLTSNYHTVFIIKVSVSCKLALHWNSYQWRNIIIMLFLDCASNCVNCTNPGNCDSCKTGYLLKADKTCEGNLIDHDTQFTIYFTGLELGVKIYQKQTQIERAD